MFGQLVYVNGEKVAQLDFAIPADVPFGFIAIPQYATEEVLGAHLAGLGTTVFEVMSALAREHNSVNLGQGFPDVDGPEDIRRFAAEEIVNGKNQYPPMMGVPELRKAVADANRRFYDLDVDWETEVLVTSGATEAISDCLAALVEPCPTAF